MDSRLFLLEIPMACEHENFDCMVTVNRLQEKEDGPVKSFCADITIKCMDCGVPFRFIGLPCGLDLNGASVSVDGTEARMAIAPKNQVMTPIDGVTGFTVRRKV
jgi:hypothetical protein